MKLIVLFSSSILILIQGCKYNPSNAQNRFDNTLTDHFPTLYELKHEASFFLIENDGFYVDNRIIHKGAYLKKMYAVDSSDIANIIKYHSLDVNDGFYHSSSDCFTCINKKNESYASKCLEIRIPIPVFFEERRFLGIEKDYLPDDFKVYIIESKKGVFLPELSLLDCMSNHWDHGYSKGIAISRKRGIVIYWLEVW